LLNKKNNNNNNGKHNYINTMTRKPSTRRSQNQNKRDRIICVQKGLAEEIGGGGGGDELELTVASSVESYRN
jgi:hypothetical protein